MADIRASRQERGGSVVRIMMLASFLIVLVPLSALPVRAEPESCAGRIVASRQWTTVVRPNFPVPAPEWDQERRDNDQDGGNNTDYGYAIDAIDPMRIFATDGYSVLRTTDGGCNWQEVFNVGAPEAGVPPSPFSRGYTTVNATKSRIRHIHTARSTSGAIRVFLELVNEGPDRVQPSLWRSQQGGDPGSWELKTYKNLASGDIGGGGSPSAYSPRTASLRISSSDPDVMYMLAGKRYDRTADGGDTWTAASSYGEDYARDLNCNWGQQVMPCDEPPLAWDFAIDPFDTNKLFAWGAGPGAGAEGDGEMGFSEDGGRSWIRLLEFQGASDLAMIAPKGGGSSHIALIPDDFGDGSSCDPESQASGDCAIAVSEDAGFSWRKVYLPPLPTGLSGNYAATSIMYGKTSSTIYVTGFFGPNPLDGTTFLNRYNVNAGTWSRPYFRPVPFRTAAVLTETSGGKRPVFWGVYDYFYLGSPPPGYGNLTIYTPLS